MTVYQTNLVLNQARLVFYHAPMMQQIVCSLLNINNINCNVNGVFLIIYNGLFNFFSKLIKQLNDVQQKRRSQAHNAGLAGLGISVVSFVLLPGAG